MAGLRWGRARRPAVTRRPARRWVPGPTPTPVDSDPLTLVWDTRGAVDAVALTLKWDLAAAVDAAALTLLWDLRAAVDAVALSLVWDLRAEANADALTLLWDLRAAVDAAALTLIWDLEAAGAATPVDSDPLSLIWDLRSEANADALTLLWDVRAEVESALTLIWDLGTEAPPEPEPEAGAGGGWREVPWKEVDSAPLRLRWGFVASPPAGKGALSDMARPEPVELAPLKPWAPRTRLPIPRPQKRAEKRKPAPEPQPIASAPLRLAWNVYAAVDAALLEIRWASSEDAREIHRLRRRVAEKAAEVKRLASALEGARQGERAAGERVEALSAEVARLADDTEALELLLLSDG
jgi:hypothetical protein